MILVSPPLFHQFTASCSPKRAKIESECGVQITVSTMPAQTPCPISDVDRALAAYINTREATLQVRRTLSRYLTSSLRPVNNATQTHHLNHECPQILSAASTNPPGLTDSRLEYLKALRARNQAQARHRELQNSLQDIHNQHIEENPPQANPEYDTDITHGYVSLLRQRRRYAQLQVIQSSLDRLLAAKPHTALVDPKASIKNLLGEQPDLPAERLELLSQTQDDQPWLFKLKQEVLEARANMERAQAARAEAKSKSRGVSSIQQQVDALELARDEIVEWVQGELVKMEEDSVFLEDASPIKRTVRDPAAPLDLEAAKSRIRASYNHYTSSRAASLTAYETLHQPLSLGADDPEEPNTTDAKHPQHPPKSSPLAITNILPHLPHLTHTAITTRALLQQSVYLQTQIAAADQDIEDALLRLSGESHLLPAGSREVSAWGRVAREADAATEEVVQECVEKSKGGMEVVGVVVEGGKLRRRLLDGV